jgi:hypothetical protein
MGIARAGRRGVFVCNQCGLVSSYSDAEIQALSSLGPDPFHTQSCNLYCLDVECDGKNCQAPKLIHRDVDETSGIDHTVESKQLRDWRLDETAKCLGGHALRFGSEMYEMRPCFSPFSAPLIYPPT